MLCVLIAGRLCEKIFFDDITTGASNDIEKATSLASQYVKTYGLGQSSKFMKIEEKGDFKNELSNYLKDKCDKEVLEILEYYYDECYKLLENNKDNIQNIASLLLEKKTIYLEDIQHIVDNK